MSPQAMLTLDTAIERQKEKLRVTKSVSARPSFKDVVNDYFAIENLEKSIKIEVKPNSPPKVIEIKNTSVNSTTKSSK